MCRGKRCCVGLVYWVVVSVLIAGNIMWMFGSQFGTFVVINGKHLTSDKLDDTTRLRTNVMGIAIAIPMLMFALPFSILIACGITRRSPCLDLLPLITIDVLCGTTLISLTVNAHLYASSSRYVYSKDNSPTFEYGKAFVVGLAFWLAAMIFTMVHIIIHLQRGWERCHCVCLPEPRTWWNGSCCCCCTYEGNCCANVQTKLRNMRMRHQTPAINLAEPMRAQVRPQENNPVEHVTVQARNLREENPQVVFVINEHHDGDVYLREPQDVEFIGTFYE